MEALATCLAESTAKVIADASVNLRQLLVDEINRREKGIWDQISAAAEITYDMSPVDENKRHFFRDNKWLDVHGELLGIFSYKLALICYDPKRCFFSGCDKPIERSYCDAKKCEFHSKQKLELFPGCEVDGIECPLDKLKIKGIRITSERISKRKYVNGQELPYSNPDIIFYEDEIVLCTFPGVKKDENFGTREAITNYGRRFVKYSNPNCGDRSSINKNSVGFIYPSRGGSRIPPVLALAMLIGPAILPYYLTLDIPVRPVEVKLRQENDILIEKNKLLSQFISSGEMEALLHMKSQYQELVKKHEALEKKLIAVNEELKRTRAKLLLTTKELTDLKAVLDQDFVEP